MKRTGGTLNIQVDPEAVSVAESIRTAAEVAPLLVLSSRALANLADELGTMEAAAEYLQGVAEATNKPLAVNIPDGPDRSSTCFIAPKDWSEERLKGWAAGHHQKLAARFGAVQRVRQIGPNRAERRRHRRES